MESLVDKNPIYDERVNEILRGMAEGKSRDDLAVELGYKNYKTLDIYMRRKNFSWDRERQKYIPTYSRLDKKDIEISLTSSSKVATVISLFKKEGADAKVIAKRLGFANHRDMANYMKSKGYKWSSEERNYLKEYGQIQDEDKTLLANSDDSAPILPRKETLEAPVPSQRFSEGIRTELSQVERFMPLLEILERNRDRLVDLIVPGAEGGKVPRYVVPGIFVTKSVHMTNTLDQMVREYSKEKNISQRDIFTVALIEFFRRYGYEREVETLLGVYGKLKSRL
ncbi:hypothetical protein ACQCN2_10040 [Brevibacillus ginsengisoli]|uniref:hypothetical protein n=1 Tax=Brevibacillus ginsengisoli TaxID=363854 RepID=UPI003CE990E3